MDLINSSWNELPDEKARFMCANTRQEIYNAPEQEYLEKLHGVSKDVCAQPVPITDGACGAPGTGDGIFTTVAYWSADAVNCWENDKSQHSAKIVSTENADAKACFEKWQKKFENCGIGKSGSFEMVSAAKENWFSKPGQPQLQGATWLSVQFARHGDYAGGDPVLKELFSDQGISGYRSAEVACITVSKARYPTFLASMTNQKTAKLGVRGWTRKEFAAPSCSYEITDGGRYDCVLFPKAGDSTSPASGDVCSFWELASDSADQFIDREGSLRAGRPTFFGMGYVDDEALPETCPETHHKVNNIPPAGVVTISADLYTYFQQLQERYGDEFLNDHDPYHARFLQKIGEDRPMSYPIAHPSEPSPAAGFLRRALDKASRPDQIASATNEFAQTDDNLRIPGLQCKLAPVPFEPIVSVIPRPWFPCWWSNWDVRWNTTTCNCYTPISTPDSFDTPNDPPMLIRGVNGKSSDSESKASGPWTEAAETWHSYYGKLSIFEQTESRLRSPLGQCVNGTATAAVRNQGSCGSCVFFSVATAASYRICIRDIDQNGVQYPNIVSGRSPNERWFLAPQHTMACNKDGHGCNGSTYTVPVNSMKDFGTVTEGDFPCSAYCDSSVSGTCVDYDVGSVQTPNYVCGGGACSSTPGVNQWSCKCPESRWNTQNPASDSRVNQYGVWNQYRVDWPQGSTGKLEENEYVWKKYLCEQGPFSVSFMVCTDFPCGTGWDGTTTVGRYWVTGNCGDEDQVYLTNGCSARGGHAVVMMGFGRKLNSAWRIINSSGVEEAFADFNGYQNYWQLQNSWGENWHNNGFVKVARGQAGDPFQIQGRNNHFYDPHVIGGFPNNGNPSGVGVVAR